jgi:glycosyltransferase involved in cell wall biosynthesis
VHKEMSCVECKIPCTLTILIVFGYGNIFKPSAGNESRLNHIIRGLSNYGHILTLERSQFKKYEAYNIDVKKRYFFNDLMVKNIYFGVFFSDFNPFYYFKVNEILKNNCPDVIQISYPRGLLAAKFCTWLNRKKALLVYEAHDLQIEVDDVNVNDSSIPFIKRYVIKYYDQIVEKIAVKIADHIITVSILDQNKFIERYSLDPQKITVIPSPIEIPPFNSIESNSYFRDFLGIDHNKIVIVFHGVYNYIPNKEAVNFIENFIAPTISKFYDDVIFVIAGKGSPKCRKNNIMFLGFVDDLNKLLKAADIAIVPILQGGGTRIKVLDYMCVGLPIVSTRKGIEGLDVNNYEEAIIVDSINDEFIDAIKCFIENEHLRKKIGSNARKRAEEKYDFEKVGENLNCLYRKLLNDRIQVRR